MAVSEVNDSNFEQHILQEKEKHVLVDFWAEWCGPCRMLAPVIEAISDVYKDKLNTFKLNTDTSMKTAQSYNISSIPCCILFKDGKEVHRIIGHKSQDAFEQELSRYL